MAKEVSVAKNLGVKSLEVNSKRLPDTATVMRLEKQVEERELRHYGRPGCVYPEIA